MRRACALLALWLGGSFFTAQAEGQFSLSFGGEFSRGVYGSGQTTSVLYLPLGLQYVARRYSWSITVPYLLVSGPGDVVVTGTGSGWRRSTVQSSSTHTEQGVGDINLSVSQMLWGEGAFRPWSALTVKIKVANADVDKGLGTGENDYALQWELAKGGTHASLGYRLLGEPPGVTLNDVWFASLSYTQALSSQTDLGTEIYVEQAVQEGLEEKQELLLFMGRELMRDRRLGVHLMKGFSDASPDWAVGINLKHRL